MIFSDGFYLDIEKIQIAHEFILDRIHRCEYPSGRGHYGLVYVLSGRAEYRFFAGAELEVGEGDVLLLSPDCAYSIAAEKEFKHYTVNFDVREESSDRKAIASPYCLLRGRGTRAMERSFRELVGVWSMKKAGYRMRSMAYLYELLSQFYFEHANGQGGASHHRLLPAKEYIEQNFALPITLERLAFVADMSVTNFRREWKKHYSESPIRYRDGIRLYYAREYLCSGYYSVAEVARKCGFDDVSYFVRFFKQKTGLTPREFKKQLLGK